MESADVVIIGGCGRVGLPLGLAFASRGSTVLLYDVNPDAVAQVNAAQMPFAEQYAPELLTETVGAGRLAATTDPKSAGLADTLVVVVGTPIDEHLNPQLDVVPQALAGCAAHLRDGQLVILRSTIHPGVTAITERLLRQQGYDIDVAYCPERIAEGRALTELFTLPQLVAARTPAASSRAEKLFRTLTDQIVLLRPEEAELAKLFTNTWRYVKFATANQFWVMANEAGVDYQRVRHAITYEYPRAADLPLPGFAAGPCLLKDTMQLASFHQNNFVLGHAAMLVNEGLPLYLVSRLAARYPLADLTVGILGMAFKGGSDDIRDSLAYKLRKLLLLRAAEVLCTDPYVVDERLVPQAQVLERADLLVVAAPHPQYAELSVRQPLVDIWGLTDRGVMV